jgi:DNA-binding transcriptional LysR family regulator
MRGDIGQYAKGLRASVRIFANTAATTEILPERLATWMAAHPQIDIELRERGSDQIARSVAAGFAEIGVLSSGVETGALVLRPFAVDRLVVVASRHHSLASERQVHFADVMGDRFVGLTSGALQAHIEAQASRLGARLKIRVRLRSFDGICRMAGAGVGIGIVPEAAARRCQRSTQITTIRLRDPWATRQLSLCIRDVRDLTPAAEALFDHLATANRESGSVIPASPSFAGKA